MYTSTVNFIYLCPAKIYTVYCILEGLGLMLSDRWRERRRNMKKETAPLLDLISAVSAVIQNSLRDAVQQAFKYVSSLLTQELQHYFTFTLIESAQTSHFKHFLNYLN